MAVWPVLVAFLTPGAPAAAAPQAPSTTQAPPPAAGEAPPAPEPVDGGWPRVDATSAGSLTMYQPQVESWDGHRLEFLAAVAMLEKGATSPIFGVVWGSAKTQLDSDTRLVALSDRQFRKVTFPSAPDKEAAWLEVMRKEVVQRVKGIALDRLTAALELTEADKAMRALELKNDPPMIVFRTTPSILVYVDGTPAYRPVKDTKLERVINTRVLLLRDKKGVHYLRVFDGWLEAPSLDGAWAVEQKPSKDLEKAREDAKQSGQVDFLLGGNPNDVKTLPSLKQKGRLPPTIVVATTPTELIVTEGEANYVPIEGTQLLFVKNTTGNVFRHLGDQKAYVLISGRWFRAASTEGPWDYVPSHGLPEDFAKIPDDSPKENVKASVAGTPQAKEALIANRIPQTAAVKVNEAKIDPPRYDSEPKLAPIDGAPPLQYVVNTATPVIQVSPTSYYAVQNGVWFTASSTAGPWTVASSVPPVIYTIPPSSPMHYVTYVRIYDTTPDVVYEGYTSGYYGTCVSGGTVVYGTGYYYPPYVGTVWYGPPVTYGSGVAMTYTPWTGWTCGFGFGWSWGAVTVGWGWGAYPWWGPVGWGYYYPYPYYRPPYWGGAAWGPWGGGAVWGPGGWAATTGNVYHRWGSTTAVTRGSGGYNAWTGNAWRGSAGMSYNSRTGNLAAGQRSAVGNVYTGSYAYGSRGSVTNTRTGQTVSGGRVTAGNVYTGNQGSAGYVRGEQGGVARVGNDVYAGKDGNVYRRTDGGWEQRTSGGGWTGVQDPSRTGTLDQQSRARSEGQQRVDGYDRSRSSGYGSGYRSGGGGTRGGGMRGGGRRR
jgi:hypothetical protein